jgi:hypothetical protein
MTRREWLEMAALVAVAGRASAQSPDAKRPKPPSGAART